MDSRTITRTQNSGMPSRLALLYPHPIHFHDLTVTIEGTIVDTSLTSPIATHSHVQNDIELVVEWPLVDIVGLLAEELVHMIVTSEEHEVRAPFHSVCVPILHIHVHGSSNLRADAVVIGLGVYRAMDFTRVIADMLHDVDLATARPPTIATDPWHHPIGCPCATGSSFQQPSANMELAIQPVCSALQFGGCEPPTTVRLKAGSDLQCTIADKCVVLAIRVELKLIVTEAVAMAVDRSPL